MILQIINRKIIDKYLRISERKIPLKKETDPIEFCNKECRRIIRKIDTETLEYRDFKTAEDFECFFHFLISKIVLCRTYCTLQLSVLQGLNNLSKKADYSCFFRQNRVRCRGSVFGGNHHQQKP